MKEIRLSHIVWPDFAQLATRVQVAQTAIEAEPILAEALSDTDFADSVGAALALSVVPIQRPAGGLAPLEDVFRRALAMLENGRPAADLVGAARDFRERLRVRLEHRACLRCNPKSPCKGTPDSEFNDDANAAGMGLCISPLSRLFDTALQLTREVYAVQTPPNVTLNTARLASFPSTAHLGVAVEARTKDEGPGSRSVNLHVYVPDFSLREYLALLYIFFHECFCHGFCGIQIDTKSFHDSESFSEGWMDWVGLQVLSAAISAGLPGPLAGAEREFRTAAGTVHRMRTDSRVAGASRTSAIYDVGAQAAERMAVLLAGITGSLRDGLPHLVRFSTAVNASDMSDRVRGRLVSSVCRIFPHSLSAPVAYQRARNDLVAAIRDYIRNKDALRLSYKIIGLSEA